jgi:hypothetical protein
MNALSKSGRRDNFPVFRIPAGKRSESQPEIGFALVEGFFELDAFIPQRLRAGPAPSASRCVVYPAGVPRSSLRATVSLLILKHTQTFSSGASSGTAARGYVVICFFLPPLALVSQALLAMLPVIAFAALDAPFRGCGDSTRGVWRCVRDRRHAGRRDAAPGA